MLSALFKILRIVGDVKAISKGKLPQRLARREIIRRVNKIGR